jgi:hypothetical protein
MTDTGLTIPTISASALAPSLWGEGTPYPTRDHFLARKLSHKDAVALSAEARIERIRARWRIREKLTRDRPNSRARRRRASRKGSNDARLALKAVKVIFGAEWRAGVERLAADRLVSQ